MTSPETIADPADPPAVPRVAEWWYLAFLIMVVFQPVFDPGAGWMEWAVTGLSVATFAPLAVVAFRTPGRLRRWAPWWSTLLGVAVFPFNGGGTVFLIYAAGFAGAHRPQRTAYGWFVGLSILTLVLGLLSSVGMPGALLFFAVPAMFVWVIGIATMDDAQRERETDRLRVDNARMEHLASAAERERIARDLHDLLGQSLTAIIVRAQIILRVLDEDPERAREQAVEMERSSRRALDEVRSAVRGWRHLDIDEEIRIAESTLAAAGVEPSVDRDAAFQPAPTVETALALVLREAVTNVVRHADARRCQLSLRGDDGHDTLVVADDGVGLNDGSGSGLNGMRERVLALGGDIEHRTDGGTTVVARVPNRSVP